MEVDARLDPDSSTADVEIHARAVVPLYTRDSVAERLAVSKPTVDRLVKDGTLRCVRIGGSVRFHPDDVDALIDSLRGA